MPCLNPDGAVCECIYSSRDSRGQRCAFSAKDIVCNAFGGINKALLLHEGGRAVKADAFAAMGAAAIGPCNADPRTTYQVASGWSRINVGPAAASCLICWQLRGRVCKS